MGKTGESSARRRATGTGEKKATAPRTRNSASRTSSPRTKRQERETPAAEPRAPASDDGATLRRATESPTERAEQTLDEIGQWVGAFAIVAGERLRRFAARAREEMEDMLAEAEAIRRGK